MSSACGCDAPSLAPGEWPVSWAADVGGTHAPGVTDLLSAENLHSTASRLASTVDLPRLWLRFPCPSTARCTGGRGAGTGAGGDQGPAGPVGGSQLLGAPGCRGGGHRGGGGIIQGAALHVEGVATSGGGGWPQSHGCRVCVSTAHPILALPVFGPCTSIVVLALLPWLSFACSRFAPELCPFTLFFPSVCQSNAAGGLRLLRRTASVVTSGLPARC